MRTQAPATEPRPQSEFLRRWLEVGRESLHCRASWSSPQPPESLHPGLVYSAPKAHCISVLSHGALRDALSSSPPHFSVKIYEYT